MKVLYSSFVIAGRALVGGMWIMVSAAGVEGPESSSERPSQEEDRESKTSESLELGLGCGEVEGRGSKWVSKWDLKREWRAAACWLEVVSRSLSDLGAESERSSSVRRFLLPSEEAMSTVQNRK